MLTAIVAAWAIGSQGEDAHCRVQLFVDEAPRFATNRIRAALRFRMEDGWHIYWRNPGDSGAAPEVKWTLPKGWKASPIVWPKPTVHVESGSTTFVHDREATLLAEIATTGAVVGQPIIADVRWLACKEACVPGSARVKTHVERRSSSESRQVIEDALNKAPNRLDSVIANQTESSLLFVFPNAIADADWKFLPNEDDVLDYSAPQKTTQRNGLRLEVAKGPLFKKDRKRLRGALISTNAYYVFDVPLNPIQGDKP